MAKVKKMAFGGIGSMPQRPVMGGVSMQPRPDVTAMQPVMRPQRPMPPMNVVPSMPNRPVRMDGMRGAGGSMFKKGGKVSSSASKRADGIAQRGKTRGKVI